MPVCSVCEQGWGWKERMKSSWQNSGVVSLVSIFMRCNCYRSASCASQGNQFARQGSTVIIYSWQERRAHNGCLNCHCCLLAQLESPLNCWWYDQRKNSCWGIPSWWEEIAASLKSVSLTLHRGQSQTLWILLFTESSNSFEVQVTRSKIFIRIKVTAENYTVHWLAP